MLQTFATGTWNIYEQQVQYVAHAGTHHFEYVPGQLEAIDRAARRIHSAPLQVAGEVVAGRPEMDCDMLVLAFGNMVDLAAGYGEADIRRRRSAQAPPARPSTWPWKT